jgi:hypothetical protein
MIALKTVKSLKSAKSLVHFSGMEINYLAAMKSPFT